MKPKKLIISFLANIFLTFAGIYGQTSVSINNMAYIDGTIITSNGTIEINSGQNARILFGVNVNNPDGLQGTLKVLTTRFSGDFPKQQGGSESIFNFNTSYTSSKDITLSSSDFNASGGSLYAEFETSGGIKYKSANYSIKVVTDTSEPQITNNTISGNQTISEGQTASALSGSIPSGGNGSYSYIWQKKTTGSWNNISGATSRGYSPGIVNSTTQYRRIVDSGTASSNISNIVKITIDNSSPILNNIISGDQTIDFGASPSIIVGSTPQGGGGTYTYYWRKNDTGAWAVIPGATGKNYSPGVLTTTTAYQRIVESVVSGATTEDSTSNVVRITVNPPPITNNLIVDNYNSYDQVSYNGPGFVLPNSIFGTTPQGGTGSYQYQWQKNDNGTWVNITVPWEDVLGVACFCVGGYTGLGYYPALPQITTHYRRIIKSGTAPWSYSNVYTHTRINTIAPQILNNFITSGNQTINSGSQASIIIGSSAESEIRDDFIYQWQKKEGSNNWTLANGIRLNKNYSPGVINFTTSFRRRVANPITGEENFTNFITIFVTSNRNVNSKSVISEESLNTVKAYPNPAINIVNFETNYKEKTNIVISVYSSFETKEIIIYDGEVSKGRQIVNWEVPNRYSKGIYFYKISSNKGSFSGKIMIKD